MAILASHAHLRDAIRVAIPSFINLLNDDGHFIRTATLSVLHKLADYVELCGAIGMILPSLVT
ncbi:hypothetical protein M408DRAFT_331250 [Serendipita vermifera MAFF 305830]|uniref:Condensin complex subunit 1 C-terminal domain-containing protein n=1 Tax=Serendipita vermifera MAFF 305830 TaxID=933852 RepID=A0A0C3B195_SERVB|nr:hypothetical protein M408DRAFT_331250 [Serendipita vermifera MAFF 305830]